MDECATSSLSTGLSFRSYERLKEYELPEERALLKWKLQTSKKGGCQGQSCTPGQLGTYSMELGAFQTDCPCLARNTECDAACTCLPPGPGVAAAEGCANRAASMRQVLQLGQDVKEIDSWGLDCYTRKNIHDGGDLNTHTGHLVHLMANVFPMPDMWQGSCILSKWEALVLLIGELLMAGQSQMILAQGLCQCIIY